MTNINTEIKVWVGDLAEYNNGRLIGEWITLPMEIDEIMEVVLVEGNEEWYVADTDCEFNVNGLSLSEMNELAERLESMNDHESEALAMIMDSGYCSDIDEAIELAENGDYRIYSNCNNMSDVAYEWYEETGMLSELEKVISSHYIDFDAIGRDMEIEGNFYYVGNATYLEIIR